MKKTLLIVLLMSITFLSFAACKKDNATEESNNEINNEINEPKEEDNSNNDNLIEEKEDEPEPVDKEEKIKEEETNKNESEVEIIEVIENEVILEDTIAFSLDQVIEAKQDLKIVVPPYFSEESPKITIEKNNIEKSKNEEIVISAYDISIEGIKEANDVFEINISYDPTLYESNNLTGAYLNPETNLWEIVPSQVSDGIVTIYTDHFSTYGIIKKDSSEQSSYKNELSLNKDQATKILEEVSMVGLANSTSAIETGFGSISQTLGATGQVTTFMQEALDVKTLSNINEHLGNIGLGMSVTQLIVDLTKGEDKKVALNATKLFVDYNISKFLSTQALKIASVGIFPIEYSIGQFTQTAIDGRYEIYEKAYELYYQKEKSQFDLNNNGAAGKWYLEIKKIIDLNKTPEETNIMIKTLLEDYVNDFWKDESTVALYESEVQASGFSGGGGLNEETKRKISQNALSKTVSALQPVFTQITRYVERNQKLEFNKKLSDAVAFFKKPVIFNVSIDASENQLENCTVYLKNKDNEVIATDKPDKEGNLFFKTTLFEYLQLKNPDIIELAYGEEIFTKTVSDVKVTTPLTIEFELEEEKELTITPENPQVMQNDFELFTAYYGDEEVDVKWKLKEFQGGVITKDGLYDAPNYTGTFHIIATYEFKGKTFSKEIAVEVIELGEFSISPNEISLEQGESIFFTAMLGDEEVFLVDWSVAGTNQGTITDIGKYTAPDKGGTFTINASYIAPNDTTLTASATVIVEGSDTDDSSSDEDIYAYNENFNYSNLTRVENPSRPGYYHLNKDGKKEGLEVEFHPDGKTIQRLYYWIDDKANGPMYAYYRDGTPYYYTELKDGQKHGLSLEYSETGILYRKENYKDGEYYGDSYYYNYNTGALTAHYIFSYENNSVIKKEIIYYENGNKYYEATYVDYQREGPYKEWYENGNLKMEGTYTNNDAKTGKWSYYKEDGSLDYTNE